LAKRNYLVEGLSGSGKSSVYEELIRRGYRAVSTDRAWKTRNSAWDEQRAVGELERPEPDVVFVCGSGRNRDRFLPHFAAVFNLCVDDDTMRRRLRERTNNDTGKEPDELERILEQNRNGEKPAGAVDLDATRPLDVVVDEILRLAECATDPAPPPWSKRGPAAARSFAVARETVTRLDYSWAGEVLATLLSYLDEQGIDLVHSAAGSIFVYTPDHSARYLARLDPVEFDGAVLRSYYERSNETEADGVEYAMLDGVAFLRDTLAPLEPANVAVLVIEQSDRGATCAST
jgi:hypothetical protein